MLKSEQIEIISEAITPLFDYLEQEVIRDIARRIAKTLTYTRTAELMAMEMKKLGYSPNKIRKEAVKLLQKDKEFQKAVEKNTIEYKKEVKTLIEDIVKKAQAEGNKLIASAGKMSWIDDLSVWKSNGVDLKQDKRLQTLVKAMQMQTSDTILNLTKTTGFKMISGFEAVENLYRTELNKAIIKIASGTFSQNTVVKDLIKELARSGLRSVDYASGRTMQLDSAVRLAVRTGAHQLAGQIQKLNIEDTGVNLVYVEEHENARNIGHGIRNHEEWQGKVYYIKGTPEDYQEEAKRIGQDKIEDLWEKTGYSIDGVHENNPLGLYGYNCLHITFPWWEGASILPDKIPPTQPVEYKGKTLDGYAQTQEMRRQEWTIRKLKREKEALQKLGQPTDEINAKIKEKNREYESFCNKCGVAPSNIRTSYEADSSDYTKTEAYKNYKNVTDKYLELIPIEENEIFDAEGFTKKDAYDIYRAIRDTSTLYKFKFDKITYRHEGKKKFLLDCRTFSNEATISNVLVINLDSRLWKQREKLKFLYETNYYAGSNVYEYALHEIAHAITLSDAQNDADVKRIYDSLLGIEVDVTRYAKESKDGAEVIAEAFVKRYQGKPYPKEAQKLLDQYIEVHRLL